MSGLLRAAQFDTINNVAFRASSYHNRIKSVSSRSRIH